jgi:hypothetical protein
MGFAIAWAAVEAQVLNYLDEIRATLKSHDTPIVLSGHSLGGALALIGAAELKRAGHNVEAVVTFGAPQVGGREFADEYEHKLGLKHCTIEFDAAGDSVPRVLRRWYYRLDRRLRYIIEQFIFKATLPKQTLYLFSGNAFSFAAVPPLSDGEVLSAIASIRRQAEIAAEEQAKQTGSGTSGAQAPSGGPSSRPGTGTSSSVGAKEGSEANKIGGSIDTVGVIGIIACVVIVCIIVGALVFRYKLRSHAVMERYALYLSTLSYGRIRSLYAADTRPITERLTGANADLTNYLVFIRGKDEWLRKKDRPLPVRLKPNLDVKTYLLGSKNII